MPPDRSQSSPCLTFGASPLLRPGLFASARRRTVRARQKHLPWRPLSRRIVHPFNPDPPLRFRMNIDTLADQIAAAEPVHSLRISDDHWPELDCDGARFVDCAFEQVQFSNCMFGEAHFANC